MEMYDKLDMAIKAYSDAIKMPTRTSLQKYNSNHIFDEDRSVRWNKDEVIRRNIEADEDTIRLCNARFSAIEGAREDIVSILSEKYNCPKTVILDLFNLIQQQWYSAYDEYDTEVVVEGIEHLFDILSRGIVWQQK